MAQQQRLFRVPPTARVLSLFGLLFPLAGLAVLVFPFPALQAGHIAAMSGKAPIAMSLLFLGSTCSLTALAGTGQLALPERWLRRLDSWYGQLPLALGLGALPLCLLAAALVIPPDSSMYGIVLVFWGASTLLNLAAAVAALGWGASRQVNSR